MTRDVPHLLTETLDWAADHEYAGYDYADGTSSRLLAGIPFEHPYLNAGFQEIAKRTPVNVRPLLRIPRRRSFKGSGLFVSALLTAAETTGDERYRDDAVRLGRWLLAHRRTDPFGWGHNHRLQTRHETIPRNTPSIVTVTYVTRGLLRLVAADDLDLPFDLPAAIRSLVTGPLGFERTDTGARMAYRAGADADHVVTNANALGAALLVEVAHACDAPSLLDLAEPLFASVAERQAPCGGWTYADPPDASHLSMDNHHNGFVLESFLRRRRLLADGTYDGTIEDALTFHRDRLFRADGAPNWDERSSYPRDVHAAAQGIITFARAGDVPFAEQILDWTVRTLRHADGSFGYRQGRLYTRHVTLMRWCQAWMARACATLLECNQSGKVSIPKQTPPAVE